MLDIELMKKKPQDGKEFIYRYYDKNNKSYIGHTKKSLLERFNGYDKERKELFKNKELDFTVEILEEVNSNESKKLEKKYIKDYNSFKNGYNRTPGGNSDRFYHRNIKYVDIKEFNKQLRFVFKTFKKRNIFFREKLSSETFNTKDGMRAFIVDKEIEISLSFDWGFQPRTYVCRKDGVYQEGCATKYELDKEQVQLIKKKQVQLIIGE